MDEGLWWWWWYQRAMNEFLCCLRDVIRDVGEEIYIFKNKQIFGFQFVCVCVWGGESSKAQAYLSLLLNSISNRVFHKKFFFSPSPPNHESKLTLINMINFPPLPPHPKRCRFRKFSKFQNSRFNFLLNYLYIYVYIFSFGKPVFKNFTFPPPPKKTPPKKNIPMIYVYIYIYFPFLSKFK